MLKFTGWREPISISGAGKVVDGILRRRPCFLTGFWTLALPAAGGCLVICVRIGLQAE
jgi:hypothetical protein